MNNKIMKKRRTLAAVLVISLLCMTGCGAANGTPDDVATNDGGSQTESETGSGGISKDDIKVGVLYISDPSEGSGYSYTHDLGVKGMQSNLGLKEDQIERKIVDDSDAVATQEAIEACISDGCNIIFTTSWATWIPQKRWQKSILKFIFLMEPAIRVMARTLLIILAESIRHGI